MKVGTDGVLLGAWADTTGRRSILDIGTGTGLIALMLAQRSDAKVDAIEIDPEAAGQATENVQDSPWSERVNVIQTSLQDFVIKAEKKYDMIACNPPFFKNSLKARTYARTVARHNDSLDLKELIYAAKVLLNADGHLNVILPSEMETAFIYMGEEVKLFPGRITRVRPHPSKDFKRVLIELSFSNQENLVNEICIETGMRHQHSHEYIELTEGFYL